MAKKSSAPETKFSPPLSAPAPAPVSALAPEPAPVSPPALEPSITTSNAIRGALQDLGLEAKKPEVAAWIKEHYPSLQYKESTLVTSLSSIKKHLRGESD